MRWKLIATLPSKRKPSIDRLRILIFHYLPLEVVPAAILIAAVFLAPSRPLSGQYLDTRCLV